MSAIFRFLMPFVFRWILGGCVAAGLGPVQSHLSLAASPFVDRQTAQRALSRVATWGCQYQDIDIDALAATGLDMVVIEPIVDAVLGRDATSGELDRLRRKPDGTRRLVLAYLSVGAAESYRPYWNPAWTTGTSPSWLGREDPNWPRSYSVRYWDPAWQDLVLRRAIELANMGFDGLFLDRLDAFHDWAEMGTQTLTQMTDLIATLGDTTRARHPAFLLIGQNAEQLLRHQRYVTTIDAISKESLFSGLQGVNVLNVDADVAWSLAYLLPIQKRGMPLFGIEYIDDMDLKTATHARYRALGIVPFFGMRLLNRLP